MDTRARRVCAGVAWNWSWGDGLDGLLERPRDSDSLRRRIADSVAAMAWGPGDVCESLMHAADAVRLTAWFHVGDVAAYVIDQANGDKWDD